MTAVEQTATQESLSGDANINDHTQWRDVATISEELKMLASFSPNFRGNGYGQYKVKGCEDPVGMGYRESLATILCCLRAEHRGKVHMHHGDKDLQTEWLEKMASRLRFDLKAYDL